MNRFLINALGPRRGLFGVRPRSLAAACGMVSAFLLSFVPALSSASAIENKLNLKVLPSLTHLVSYPAAGPTKGRLVVFSEPDCGPCMMFVKDIKHLNSIGYRVDVGFFNHDPSKRAAYQAVLCSPNPAVAMMALYQSRVSPPAVRCGASVDDQFEKAQLMGAYASPFFVFENGAARHGYQGLNQLVAWLDDQRALESK